MSVGTKTEANSINQTKKHLIDEDPSIEKDYPPYIINRCLSGHLDCIMFANEMNIHNNIPKKMQYDFYLNSLRKKKRFSPWKPNKIKSKILTTSNVIMDIVMRKQSKL